MGFLTWLLLGLVAGVVAKFVMGDRLGWIITVLLGIIGAFVGGWIFGFFGGPGVTDSTFMSIIVAAVSAIVALFVYGPTARSR